MRAFKGTFRDIGWARATPPTRDLRRGRGVQRGGRRFDFRTLAPPPRLCIECVGEEEEFHGSVILLAKKVGCQFSRFLPKKTKQPYYLYYPITVGRQVSRTDIIIGKPPLSSFEPRRPPPSRRLLMYPTLFSSSYLTPMLLRWDPPPPDAISQKIKESTKLYLGRWWVLDCTFERPCAHVGPS